MGCLVSTHERVPITVTGVPVEVPIAVTVADPVGNSGETRGIFPEETPVPTKRVVLRSIVKKEEKINSIMGSRSTKYVPPVTIYSDTFFICPEHWRETESDTWPRSMVFLSRTPGRYKCILKGDNVIKSIDEYYYNDTVLLGLKDFMLSEMKKHTNDFRIMKECYNNGNWSISTK